MPGDFIIDRDLLVVSKAYALDCMDFCASRFSLRLDFSPDSVAEVEECLEALHNEMLTSRSTRDQLQLISKMFGSYLGEAFRRSHGGDWGVCFDGTPGFKIIGGGVCFPAARVHKRLVNGSDDNVLHWFEFLVDKKADESLQLPGGLYSATLVSPFPETTKPSPLSTIRAQGLASLGPRSLSGAPSPRVSLVARVIQPWAPPAVFGLVIAMLNFALVLFAMKQMGPLHLKDSSLEPWQANALVALAGLIVSCGNGGAGFVGFVLVRAILRTLLRSGAR